MGKKGIKSGQLNAFMVIVSIILAIAFLVVSFSLASTYEQLNNIIYHQQELQQSAYDLRSGSDYLTDQVRLYVITGNKENCDNFFYETQVTRTRDKALEVLEEDIEQDAEVKQALENALNESNELIKVEKYAMRLVAEANHGNLSLYPEDIQNTALSIEDKALSAEEMKAKALDLVYNQFYRDSKARIYAYTESATDTIIESASVLRSETSARYSHLLFLQNVIILLVLVAVIAFLLLFNKLFVSPLHNFRSAMEKQEYLKEEGSEELQILASTYNQMLEQIEDSQTELSYEASHDPLTGLYNRKIFENTKNNVSDAALLLIDVDYFKQINDNYGHDIGDKVLVKIANIMKENFRSEDYVCRIGGDEFAVIMMHVNPSLKSLIEYKVIRMNEQMHDTSDGLPYNSLSIGIAFTTENNEDLYVNCDKALYEAKEAGKNGYRFYES